MSSSCPSGWPECERGAVLPPIFLAKYRGHRGQTSKGKHPCGLTWHGAPGTNRGLAGNKVGTLIDDEDESSLSLHTYVYTALSPGTSPHLVGIQRGRSSPGALYRPRTVRHCLFLGAMLVAIFLICQSPPLVNSVSIAFPGASIDCIVKIRLCRTPQPLFFGLLASPFFRL